MNKHNLKLYQSGGSPNARRVRIYLAERGICVNMVPVDLGAREQFSGAYAAVNPRQVVPTLVLGDGVAIGEVPAIWRYLEDIYPDRSLFGDTPKERALATMWERRMEQEGFAPTVEAVRNAAPAFKGRAISGPHAYVQIPELIERSRQRVRNFHGDLEVLLEDRSFIAGERFSVADITALVAIDFAAQALRLPIAEDAVATQRWYDAVSSRPSMSA